MFRFLVFQRLRRLEGMGVWFLAVWLSIKFLVGGSVFGFFLWGLPMLIGSSSLFEFLGLSIPKDTAYFRLFGAVVTALGFLYWLAYKDPIKNVDIIKYAIVDNGLATLTLGVLILTGKGNWMFIMSAVFTFLVFISFILLFPGKEFEIKTERLVYR